MRGWEVGGEHFFEEDEDDLVICDPKNADVDGQDSRLDEDEWGNCRVDDPELDPVDDWDEDDGLRTPSSHSNCCGTESHRSKSVCDRDAICTQVVTGRRASHRLRAHARFCEGAEPSLC